MRLVTKARGVKPPSNFGDRLAPRSAATIPSGYGKCVGICETRGQVIVACENGVFRLDDEELVPIPFAQATK